MLSATGGCAAGVLSTLAALRLAATRDRGSGDLRDAVRAAYGRTAAGGQSVLPGDAGDPRKRNGLLGYVTGEVVASADLGLGCGNPLAAAKLQPGEKVLDLGSGAGMDCFIAGKAVGPDGMVIGVDMTPEMLMKARENAGKENAQNVQFRLGEIEHLPVGDGMMDCIISNCVINLSLDKASVYREMNRVLKPGGRVSISDVLRTAAIPERLKTVESYSCWVAGASAEDEIRDLLVGAGFTGIDIQVKENAADIIKGWMPGSGAEKFITSAYVTATKPKNGAGVKDCLKSVVAPEPAVIFRDEGKSKPTGCWG